MLYENININEGRDIRRSFSQFSDTIKFIKQLIRQAVISVACSYGVKKTETLAIYLLKQMELQQKDRGKVSRNREIEMTNALNGCEYDKPVFPCDISEFLEKRPVKTPVKLEGGMTKHHDLIFTGSDRPNIELKVTNKKGSSLDKLTWQPWCDTVQFLQGQVKSEMASSFLGECGENLLREWHRRIGVSFSYDEYMRAMYSLSDATFEKCNPDAIKFITDLRSDKLLQKKYQKLWLQLEEDWFSSHCPDRPKLEEVIRNIIEQKHWWICISKTGAHWIPGMKVCGLKFVGRSRKPKGGMLFNYILVVGREDETREIPIVLKYHWKNGGQAVQNLNIMIV